MSLTFLTAPQKRLLAGITSASTQFYLTDIKSFDGETDIDPSSLGTIHFCCLRNDTGTIIELMQIDPSTLIADGAVTIVRRGLSFYGDLTTEHTNLKLDFPAGTICMLGTDVPQIFQWLKEYIDAASIAGAVPASTVAAGIVVESSLAEIQAGTATKTISSVVYKLFAPLDKLKTYILSFIASETLQGFVEEATNAEVTAGTATGATGYKLFVSPTKLATRLLSFLPRSELKFGGNGTDGALSISSGTTNIDCAGASILIKNYSSISITGTGKLTFSNPHANGTTIILRSQGNVTLTSSQAPMIDCTNMGATATNSSYNGMFTVTNGGNGTGVLANQNVAGGTAGSISLNPQAMTVATLRYNSLIVGTKGGVGGAYSINNSGTASATGGTAGTGGGALVIECAGSWNFTTTGGISVAGVNGGNGTATRTVDGAAAAGGGGGGGGGTFLGLYNTLIANSGTVTITGGTGGTGVATAGNGQAESTGGGGGGGKGSGTSAGSLTTAGATNGGNGGVGWSFTGLNTEFL